MHKQGQVLNNRYPIHAVLELGYTANDLHPFAEDMGYHGDPFRWDDPSTGSGRRAQPRAELDATYARLYGLTRDELRYTPCGVDPKEICLYGEAMRRTSRLAEGGGVGWSRSRMNASRELWQLTNKSKHRSS